MAALIRMVLDKVGLRQERFALQWASAAEAPRFVKLITEFTGQVRELGALGQAEGIEPEEMRVRLAKALAVVSDRKLRMVFGNAAKTIRQDGNFTGENISRVIEEKLAKKVDEAFAAPAEQAAGEDDSAQKAVSPAKTPPAKKPAEKKKPPVKAKKASVSKKATPQKTASKKAAVKKKK